MFPLTCRVSSSLWTVGSGSWTRSLSQCVLCSSTCSDLQLHTQSSNMLQPGNESSAWADLRETNRSEKAAEGDVTGPEAVVVPVVFGLIFVVGVVGNSVVMVVIGRVRYSGGGRVSGGGGGGGVRRPGSPTNIFILNLSAADLLFLLFCVPFHATIYSLPQWVFGAFLCKFGHFFSSVSMLVSIFTLVAMSADRYVAVVRSRKAPCVRSRRNALAGVCVIWTLSLLCSVPVAQHQVLTSHPSAPNSTFCWEQWSGASKRAYRVTVLVLGYLLPLLLISCCYTRVSSKRSSFNRIMFDCPCCKTWLITTQGPKCAHEVLTLIKLCVKLTPSAQRRHGVNTRGKFQNKIKVSQACKSADWTGSLRTQSDKVLLGFFRITHEVVEQLQSGNHLNVLTCTTRTRV